MAAEPPRAKRQPVKRPKKANPHNHAGNKFGPKAINRRLTRSEQEALRMAAELYYTLDLKSVDVATMARMEQFSGISQSTLAAWAKAGNWDGKRQAQRQQWSGELKRKLSEQLVQHEYDDWQKLKQLHEQAFSFAIGSDEGVMPAPPRSFAEAAKLYIALDQALSARRERMLEGFGMAADSVGGAGVQPNAASAGQPSSPAGQMALPEMSADEYQELAHTLMARSFDAAQTPPTTPPIDIASQP